MEGNFEEVRREEDLEKTAHSWQLDLFLKLDLKKTSVHKCPENSNIAAWLVVVPAKALVAMYTGDAGEI